MCHFFFKIARSVYINSALTVLAFHCRGMLEMVSRQKTAILKFFCVTDSTQLNEVLA